MYAAGNVLFFQNVFKYWSQTLILFTKKCPVGSTNTSGYISTFINERPDALESIYASVLGS